MTEIVSTVPISVHRPDLSQTLKTCNLYSNDKFMRNDIEYDSKSDSSSICHSPSWDDISGSKCKTAKREKKRREMELEKARQKNLMSLEPKEPASRPKKLSKHPPISNRLSKIKIPNSGIDFGKLSLSKTPPHSHDSQQENCSYVGGLRLRPAEEAHVQEAIRKIRPCHENRFSSQRLGPQNMYNSSNGQLKEETYNDGIEKSLTDWDPYYVSPCSSSDSATRLNSVEHITESPDTKILRKEKPLSHDSSIWSRDMQNVKTSNSNTLVDSNQYVNDDTNYRMLDPNNTWKQKLQSEDLTCEISKYDVESYQQTSVDMMPVTGSTRGVVNATESQIVSAQSEELKMVMDDKEGASSHRHSTEKSNQSSPVDTSEEPKSAPLEKESKKYSPKLPSYLGLKDIKMAARSVLGRNSVHLSHDFLLDYYNADQQSDFRVRNNHTSNYLSTSSGNSPTGLDGSGVSLGNLDLNKSAPTPSVLETAAQQFKHSFYGSQFSPDPMNPSLRSSFAQSTDSSEEYSTQDELSNITTPTASRPHSSMEKSPVETRREKLFPTRLESLPVKNEFYKSAPDNKLLAEDCTSRPTNPTIWLSGSSQKKSASAEILPTQSSLKKDHEASSPYHPEIKMPQAPITSPLPSPWSLREGKDGILKRGLIKRPPKQYRPPPTVNPRLNSGSNNSSQYLQNARLRINNDTSLPMSRYSKASPVSRNNVEPFAKMFVVCCSCKYFHDLPSKLYASMAHPGDVVNDEKLGVSGVVTTSVKCPWCGHGMTTKCCGGYAAVVYMKERFH